MHGDTANSDNLWIAAAPMFELDWTVETNMYIPEGPTYDRQGNVYVSPLQPPENVSLISLDGITGERRWSIPGEERNFGSGAILILNNPDNTNTDLISQHLCSLDGNSYKWRYHLGNTYRTEFRATR